MSKGSPSMVALLGLLAVAGFQNRDRLSQLMQPDSGNSPDRSADGSSDGLARFGDDDQPANRGHRYGDADQPANGGLVDNLRRMFTGNGGVAGGLTELLGRFTNPVQAAKANTWVDTGPNGELFPGDLDEVLDDETVADLMDKTGLSRSDLMARLSAVLPDAVDQLTPQGRLPSADEARLVY